MRAQARQIAHEEEEESAFVSMTDMTVGFLFIIMILLVFFASQVRNQDVVDRTIYEDVVVQRNELRDLADARRERIIVLEKELAEVTAERDVLRDEVESLKALLRDMRVKVANLEKKVEEARLREAALRQEIETLSEQLSERDQTIAELRAEIMRLEEELRKVRTIDPLEAYLARVADTRRLVLIRLRDALLQDFPNLQVALSEESDALRFQGEGLFVSGQSSLASDKQVIVARVAERLDEILPCFTIGTRSAFNETCNPGFVMIEAVQIEGHTDDVGTEYFNRVLSTSRANNTFFRMAQAAPAIMEHHNLQNQPVLSVAAYGPDRPIADNRTPAGRATNRRIDLRFIMVTPQDNGGIAGIRQALKPVGIVDE
ncbi:OmpA family protein [Oceaniglobus roseus]|uniref:OmpA family protein n=1 Tax=Oceaniglobus roseus TaxID=1737570 RepID=UPI0012FFE071|nr:OmpA family protein [Kandeliimicrobium roseum]